MPTVEKQWKTTILGREIGKKANVNEISTQTADCGSKIAV
jgi:hypothetical protein